MKNHDSFLVQTVKYNFFFLRALCIVLWTAYLFSSRFVFYVPDWINKIKTNLNWTGPWFINCMFKNKIYQNRNDTKNKILNIKPGSNHTKPNWLQWTVKAFIKYTQKSHPRSDKNCKQKNRVSGNPEIIKRYPNIRMR